MMVLWKRMERVGWWKSFEVNWLLRRNEMVVDWGMEVWGIDWKGGDIVDGMGVEVCWW